MRVSLSKFCGIWKQHLNINPYSCRLDEDKLEYSPARIELTTLSDPNMVCVLPVPVWPYTNMVVLNPSQKLSTQPLPIAFYSSV